MYDEVNFVNSCTIAFQIRTYENNDVMSVVDAVAFFSQQQLHFFLNDKNAQNFCQRQKNAVIITNKKKRDRCPLFALMITITIINNLSLLTPPKLPKVKFFRSSFCC